MVRQIYKCCSWVTGAQDFSSYEIGFANISFNRLYRELNSEPDRMSKDGVGEMDGVIHYEEFLDLVVEEGGSYRFF